MVPSQIREHFDGNHSRDARIPGGFLQRHGRAERRPEEDDRSGRQRIDHAPQVLLLEIAVRADVPLRRAVAAAIVGDDIQSHWRNAPDESDAAAPVVRRAVQVDDGATLGPFRAAVPATKSNAFTGELAFVAIGGARGQALTPRGVQQTTGGDRGELARAQRDRGAEERARGD
jgi:hypothetical protein